MGFTINSGQKVRIALSERAKIILNDDINSFNEDTKYLKDDIFEPNSFSSFINTVFANFKYYAKASISLYLNRREEELNDFFADLDTNTRQKVVKIILDKEKKEIEEKASRRTAAEGENNLYYINNDNVQYLLECTENEYYKGPGQYIRSVIEEYCSLPFIERERIYKRDVFDKVQSACQEKRMLKIKAKFRGKDTIFDVYPYKIVPDFLHTQLYLVCYSKKQDENKDDKVKASFNMARMNLLRKTEKPFFLSKDDEAKLDKAIIRDDLAYLFGENETIKVRLTKRGKQMFDRRPYSRPRPVNKNQRPDDINDDVYEFYCSRMQILNYFFSFDKEATVISPTSLALKFHDKYKAASDLYQKLLMPKNTEEE